GGEPAAPYHVTLFVGHPLGQTIQFGVVPENIRLFANAVDPCHRLPTSFAVEILRVARRLKATALPHHPQAAPQERDNLGFLSVAVQGFLRVVLRRVLFKVLFCFEYGLISTFQDAAPFIFSKIPNIALLVNKAYQGGEEMTTVVNMMVIKFIL
ncbi:MAG: hypothetical protein WBW72_11720, partial [Erwinia billingiae]